jgi:hypothetical protein
MRRNLLIAGGILNVIMAVFHMAFWSLFNWPEELPKLSPENRGIMSMLNVAWIYTVLSNALISFYLAAIKQTNFLHKILMAIIGGGYLLRIGFGYPLFGFDMAELFVWVYCLATALCYGFALWQRD